MKYEVVIIGGGASGLMAAVAAASAGAEVCVLERAERVGKTLLATGNGRCNLSNELLDSPEDACLFYNDPEFVLPLLTEYDLTQIIQLFGDLGLAVTVDERGLVWPRTNSAVSVLQVLRNRLEYLDVEILTETEVTTLNDLESKAIILACGHGSLLHNVKGHACHPLRPVLGPLACTSPLLKGLDGVRVKAQARLVRGGEPTGEVATGELHFKKDGLSGIMIFDLSRAARVGDTVSVDLFADLNAHELAHYLELRAGLLEGYPPERAFDGLLHPRLAASFIRIASELNDHERAHLLKDLRFEVTDLPTAEQAQVMRGGLATEQFDLYTLESLITPGLFACGEALDVDGACGGYNLHWAWASGWQAGLSAAERVIG